MATQNVLIDKLAAASAASAQTMANYRLQLIGNQLTAQLNKKIAQLKDQSQDPQVTTLNNQATQYSQQKSAYGAIASQYGQNTNIISDMKIQLGNAAFAASNGDSAGFDSAMSTVQEDIGVLQVVPYQAGMQNDGVAYVKNNGLGIQSSATYNLSTTAGQQQAVSDVQSAQGIVDQMFATTSQNQQIAGSIVTALAGQMSEISTQVSNLQNAEITNAAATIQNLQQQTQTEYHLIELNFGTIGQAASVLTSLETQAQASQVQDGTAYSLLVNQGQTPGLMVANMAPITPSASSSTAGSSATQTGAIISTTA